MGAREDSWKLNELLDERLADGASEGLEPKTLDDDELAFVTGRNNRYRKLSIEEEEDW